MPKPIPVAESIVDAFIENNGKFLMIRRADDRKFYPGVWASVGGHVEPNEAYTPALACLRELKEETGIKPESVYDLVLRYVIIRMQAGLITTHYVFFGKSSTADVMECAEGRLEWICKDKLLDLKMTDYFRELVAHYLDIAANDELLYLGMLGGEGRLSFEILRDWS